MLETHVPTSTLGEYVSFHVLFKRSPGIIRKSRVSYPGPGFLSSATWPSLLKKHYNGLNKLNQFNKLHMLLMIHVYALAQMRQVK